MQKLELLDYRGAAEFIGLSEFTLRRYVSHRKIPFVKLGEKAVRFEPSQLISWVESQRRSPRSSKANA
jgi:excisionase family DNA binding protein